VASCAALTLSGCSSGGELPQDVSDTGPPAEPAPGVIRLPFLVDDYFVPNGCFGDEDCSADVITIDSHGCQDVPASAQGVCRLYSYKPSPVGAPGHKNHLGILSQDVGPGGESQIGKVPPLPVQPGAKHSVFWAKVGVGPVKVAFRAGGANNWEGDTDPKLPYKDTFGVPGDVTLDEDFQKIVIDLSGVTYSDVVSPFGWALVDATEQVDLYIADVRWE
jgi:hypothetical protein